VLFSGQGKIECNQLDQYSRTGSYSLTPDEANLQTDPKLTAYKEGKVEFAPDSPARALGIEPIDVTDAGPRR
jgi:hypothetical protein